MKTTTQPKKPTNVLTIHIDRNKISRGHTSHRTGAGPHKHKTTKRNRTRTAQRQNALRDH